MAMKLMSSISEYLYFYRHQYFHVLLICREIFIRPSKSVGNIILKVMIFVLCIFLVVLGTSIIMLCCLYPSDDDSTDLETLDG